MANEKERILVRVNLLCTDCPGEHCTLSAVLVVPEDGDAYPKHCPYAGHDMIANWQEYKPEVREA